MQSVTSYSVFELLKRKVLKRKPYLFFECDHLQNDLLSAGEAARRFDGDAVFDLAAYRVLIAGRLLGEFRFALALGQDFNL